eukprot:COSAG06_NODE_3729_length_4970_cov_202.110655_1_plen_851_part_10
MADAQEEAVRGAEAPLPPGCVQQEEDRSAESGGSSQPPPPAPLSLPNEEVPLIPPTAAPAAEPGAMGGSAAVRLAGLLLKATPPPMEFEKNRRKPNDLSKPIKPAEPTVAQATKTAAQAFGLLEEKTEDGAPALEAAIASGLFASLLIAEGQAEEQPPWQSWVQFADGAPGGGKGGDKPQPRVQLIAALLLHDIGAADGDALASERGALLKCMVGAQLQHASLQSAQLQHAFLEFAQLQHANLRSAQLQHAYLRSAQLQHAILRCAQLQHASLYSAQLQHAILYSAQLQHASLKSAQLQHASLYSAQLQHASLESAQLQHASLKSAQLQHASLESAQLQHASLESAQLQHASLESAQLQHAILTKALLHGAIFTKAILRNADLSFALLHELLIPAHKETIQNCPVCLLEPIGTPTSDSNATDAEGKTAEEPTRGLAPGDRVRATGTLSAIVTEGTEGVVKRLNAGNSSATVEFDVPETTIRAATLDNCDLTGAIFEGTILTGVTMQDATFSRLQLPPKRVPAPPKAGLGRALAFFCGEQLVDGLNAAASQEEIDDTADDADAQEDDIETGTTEDAEAKDLRALQETLTKQATGRVGEHIVIVLTHLLRARVAVEEKYDEIRGAMKAWKPQLSGKSFHGKPELQTVCGGIEQVLTAQFEILMTQLEASVTSAKFWADASMEDDDLNDSGSLIASLSKTAVEFVVKEVCKTLVRKADPFIKSAAQDFGFQIHKTLHQATAAETAAAPATEKSTELQELVDGTNADAPEELLQKAIRGLLAKLEASMQRSFESNLSGRVIKVSSSLLSQLHGGSSTFNELEKKAKEFDELLSAKVIGTALTPGRVRLALRLDQL